MKKILAGLAVATMLSSFSGIANASDSSGLYFVVQGGALSYPTSSLADYYAGIGTGSLSYPSESGNPFGGGTGRPLRGIVGLQMGPRFAVEASGIYFGKTTFSGFNATDTVTATSRAAGSSLTLVSIASGGQPGDYLSLLVKLGVAYIHSSSTITATGSLAGGTHSPMGSGSGVDVTYGLGIQSDMTDSLSLRLDWDTYPSAKDGAGRFSTILLGLGYKF
jgi:opacity protein-like surface antigen